jgi:hypothetical protein
VCQVVGLYATPPISCVVCVIPIILVANITGVAQSCGCWRCLCRRPRPGSWSSDTAHRCASSTSTYVPHTHTSPQQSPSAHTHRVACGAWRV